MAKRLYCSYHHEVTAEDRQVGLWIQSAGHFVACDHVCPLRVRSDFLVIYCTAGRGIYEASGASRTVKAGQAFAGLPGLRHAYHSDPRIGWDIWFCHFDGDQAARLVKLIGFRPEELVLPLGMSREVSGAFAAICSALKQRGPNASLDATGHLFQLLLLLRTRPRMEGMEARGLLRALEADPDDLDAMAAAAGLSKYHFARAFRRATGLSPWRYVLNRRISRAKELLADTDLPVKQVTFQAGFKDPDYFSRRFKQETGCAPTAFRSQAR